MELRRKKRPTLQHNAAQLCNTLQRRAAKHCNTLQHTATHLGDKRRRGKQETELYERPTCLRIRTCPRIMSHSATHCNTALQHSTATHCNRALQHTALQHAATPLKGPACLRVPTCLCVTSSAATHCSTILQHSTATQYCNILR